MHHTYINGKITESQNATIGITDLGFLRGYGLFDYFRTYNGQPFRWDSYWNRFETSAKKMGIPIPISKEETHQIVMQLLGMSGLQNTAFRLILTGGFAADSITMTHPNLVISSEDIHPVPAVQYSEGIKIISHDFVRDLPEIKSTDYKHLMILRPTILAAGASDVLFHKDYEISELSRSNLFVFKENVLITPNAAILNGITRQVVIELAKPFFLVEERPLKVDELFDADEVFTTSSTKRILPITQVDKAIFSEGKAGKNTKFLMQIFDKMIENYH